MHSLTRLLATSVGLCVWSGCIAAHASVAYVKVGQDFAAAPVLFSFDGGSFSFSSTGDPFNPASIQTTGPAAVSSFGGFLGIPITPTTDFINRGTVVYGSGQMFSSFPAPTTIPYSNGDNFLGLEVALNGQDYFGFAYTTNMVLNSYGFETVPGQAITATTAVPEPASWAMLIAGFCGVGGVMRSRTRKRMPAALLPVVK